MIISYRKKINIHHRAKPYTNEDDSTQVPVNNAIEPSAPHYDDQYNITTFGHNLSQPTYGISTSPHAEPTITMQSVYDAQQLPYEKLSSDNHKKSPISLLQQSQNAKLSDDAQKYIDINDDDNDYRTETPEQRNTHLSLKVPRSMPDEGAY